MAGAVDLWALSSKNILVQLARARYSFAARFVAGDVADIGCGFGYGASILLQSAAVRSLVCVDIDKRALWRAHEMVADPRARFELVDVENQRLPHADWYVLCEVLEHLHRPADVVERVQRRARAGVVISVPLGQTTNPYHRHVMSADRVEDAFAQPSHGCWRMLESQRLHETEHTEYGLWAWERVTT